MNTHPPPVEVLEARIAPAVDLLLLDFALSLPAGGVTVPGDSVGVGFSVANFGDTTANAPNGANVELWLSANQTLGSFDLKLGNLPVGKFSLDALETKAVTGRFTMPTLSLPTPVMPAGDYYIIHRLISPVGESNLANNTEPTDTTFPYLFQFGNVGTRKNVPLAIGGGEALKLTLAGAGTGEFVPQNNQAAPQNQLADLIFTGTDGKSAAKLVVKPGFGINFDDITANSPLGSLDIFASNVRGDLRFNGGLGKLVAGAIDPTGFSGDDSVLVIGAGLGKPVHLDIFAVGDVDISSAVGISMLETHVWFDRNAATSPSHADVIIAPFINKLYVTPAPVKTGTVPLAPEFHADLYLTGDPSATYVLNDVKVTGPVMDATWFMADFPDLDVNTVRLDTAEDFKLIASGIVKQFHAFTWDNTGTSGAMFDAASVGTFKVAGVNASGVGLLGESIVIRGSDSKGVAIKNFVATLADIQLLSAENGGIEKLGVGDWEIESPIKTQWIKTLAAVGSIVSVGNFAADLMLTGANAKGVSLGGALIQGLASGDWTVAGDTMAVQIESTDAGFEFRGEDVGKFTVLNTFAGLLRGKLDKVTVDTLAGSIYGEGATLGRIKADTVHMIAPDRITAEGTLESLEAKEWTRGNVTAGQIRSFLVNGRTSEGEGNLSDAFITLNLAGGVTDIFRVAGKMKNVNINAPSLDYDFVDFSADSWDTGSLDAGWVRKMTFDGGGQARNGFLLDVDIRLYAFEVQNLASLGTLKVAGAVDTDTRITLTHDAGSVTVGAFLNSFFQSQTNVQSFLVTGIKGGAEPFFTRSEVRADRFGTVVVNLVDGGGVNPSGFFAQTIASYTRKDGLGVVFSDKNLAGVQGAIFDPVLPAYAVHDHLIASGILAWPFGIPAVRIAP